MSPLPHPHTPGKMWAAICDYVQKLMNPLEFEKKMSDFKPGGGACVGECRYCAEHWGHSHPSVMPCDLSNDKAYTWNYKDVPPHDFVMELKPAPRFNLSAYEKKECFYPTGINVEERLTEHQTLYGTKAPESWWGWKLFRMKYKS